MYAGRVAFVPHMSDGEQVVGRDRDIQTDGRMQTDTLCFPLDAASVKSKKKTKCEL